MPKFSRDDVDKFHDYSLYIPKRTLYMGSEENSMDSGESGTDGGMAERVIKNLLILEGLSLDPITIIMNNLGGEFLHGLAIYDAVKACRSHVTIKVFGHAMSAGSIILQAADDRVMAPHSSQMIHYGTWSFSGHSKTGQKWAKDFEKGDEWMERMYLDRIHQKIPDFNLKRLKSMLNHDTFLSPQESVALGLADKVLGEDNENI